MSDNEKNNTFASFMTSKSLKEEKNGFRNKTKEALDTSKEEQEKEKKKELDEAKKNSMALANRYGKSDMMKLQAKNFAMMIPFIALGILIFIILLMNGGTWLSSGLNAVFKALTGSK